MLCTVGCKLQQKELGGRASLVPLARELQQKELGVGASFTAGLIPDFMKPAVNPSEQTLLLPEMLSTSAIVKTVVSDDKILEIVTYQ